MIGDPRSKRATVEERRGLRPVQLVCLLGAFISTMVALLAFDEPSVELIVVGMAFAGVIGLDAIWRGLTTGELPYRERMIDGTREPFTYVGVLLLYAFMVGALIYLGVDMLTSEL